MLDGAAKITPMLAEAQRLEMPAIGMTDHGNMFGASEFYNAATEVGHQADHRRRGLHRARLAVRHQAHPVGRSRPEGRRRLGQRLLHPHDDGRRERHRAAQPVQAVVAGVVRGPARQVVADGRRDHRRARRGHHRHHRLPVRRGADPAAARPRPRGAGVGRQVAGDLRPGQLLPRVDGPRPVDRAPGPRGAAGDRPQARHPGRWPPTTATTSPATPRTTTRRCCACRPARRCRIPTGSSSTATATT